MSQRGVTIIEMMVSIVIGMGLVSALLGIFSNSTGANLASNAQAQMNDDAQFALQLIAKHIRLASYQNSTAPAGPLYGLFGCDNGFNNASGAAAAANTTTLNCNAAATTVGHGLLVSYHADRFNTTPHTTNLDANGFGLPTDCTGNSRALIAGTNYTLIENRFFVTNNTLSCAGNGGATPFVTAVPLVENVERIEFDYGVSNGITTSVAGYLTGDQLGAATAAVNPVNWPRVVSVRICITMRSQNRVIDGPTVSYYPCNPERNNVVTVTDNSNPKQFARKTYTMTVALRNRL